MNRVIISMLSLIPNPQSAVRALRRYAERAPFRAYCDALARNMVVNINKRVYASWREAARNAGRGKAGIIYAGIMQELETGSYSDAFYNIIAENAHYIKSLPLDLAQDLTDFIQGKTLEGRRASSLTEELMQKYKELSESRINLIARTEVSKTQTALTRARAENLGLEWYVWRTSEDQRVRSSHEHMSDVLIRWGDPPNPEALAPAAPDNRESHGSYHAGEIFNCRCYPEPVVSADFLSFPMKVYQNGGIRSMTKAQFERVAERS